MKCSKAVDHHDAWPKLFQEALDRGQYVVEAVTTEDLAEVLIDDATLPDGIRIEDLEGFAESKDLVQRLGEGGEIQCRTLVRRVVERELLAEDRLAAAGHPDDQVDRVLEQAAVQDLVESWVAARESLDQRVTGERRD